MAETELNERDEVEAMLPFLANNTLEGEDRTRVEAAVGADPDLAMQLRALRRIRREVKAEAIDWSPGESGLAKLLGEIDATATTAAPVAEPEAPTVQTAVDTSDVTATATPEATPVEPVDDTVADELAETLSPTPVPEFLSSSAAKKEASAEAETAKASTRRTSRLTLGDAVTGPASETITTPQTAITPAAPANTNARIRIWQIAAAVALAAFAAQSVFVWTGSGGRPDVEMASGDAMGPIGDGRLRIAFQPTATEGDIRALFLAQNLIIVDGPSALGLYTVAVEQEAIDDALAALLSKRSVIETVSVGQ